MTHKALIRKLQISCLGLDPVDPLRLLVDDVVEALAQTERTWVGLTDEEIKKISKKHKWHESNVAPHLMPVFRSLEAKLKEKNT